MAINTNQLKYGGKERERERERGPKKRRVCLLSSAVAERLAMISRVCVAVLTVLNMIA